MSFFPNPSLRLRKTVTVILWLAGLSLAVVVLARRPVGDAQGIAWAESSVVSSSDDGVLLEVQVGLHDGVESNRLLARLDPTRLLLRTEVLKAELRALSAEESAEAMGRSRRFQGDREDARVEQARLRASVAEEEARLAARETELARQERLAARGLSAPARAEDLRKEVAVIRTRLEAERERLDLAAQTLGAASSRAATATGPNRWLITAAEGRLDEVGHRLERLNLRSPISGQVTQVLASPGEWVEAGQPILRISPVTAGEVHVWTDLRTSHKAEVGRRATVRRASGSRLDGTVVSVAAESLVRPPALWYRSDIQEWGYLVRVAVEGEALAPGETVRVSLN